MPSVPSKCNIPTLDAGEFNNDREFYILGNMTIHPSSLQSIVTIVTMGIWIHFNTLNIRAFIALLIVCWVLQGGEFLWENMQNREIAEQNSLFLTPMKFHW